ncbi:MAG TPA: hypothetical protein PLM98_10865, partial [Thiolinea sp.]|nr:hypothetical protein [Thiolinea sp.]
RPQQVKAIYIRDVSPEETRDEEVLRLATKAAEHQIDLCLVESTLEAATHAVAKGFIPAQVLEQLQAEMSQPKDRPLHIESVINP